MTRVTTRRRVSEIAHAPSRMAKAYLAETYDGIGQVVDVSMSRGAITQAFKVRIAAGDFGGRRTFPVGTPVILTSIRGKLEVFLGNFPGGCDPLSRDSDEPYGGWGEGPFGLWLSPYEMQQVDSIPPAGSPLDPTGTGRSPYAWSADGEGLLQDSGDTGFDDASSSQGIYFEAGHSYPMEVTFEYYATGDFFGDNKNSFFLVFGPGFVQDTVAGIQFQNINDPFNPGNIDLTILAQSQFGYNFPMDEVNLTTTQDVSSLTDRRWVKARVDEEGAFFKTWRSDGEAPDDWQLSSLWTGTPPPVDHYRFIQLIALVGGIVAPQPIFHVTQFCLNTVPR